MLFAVYTGRNLVFLLACTVCESHLLRQGWICPEIICDLDEGERERKDRVGE